MSSLDVIRWAGRERVTLSTRGDRLAIEAHAPPPADLFAAIKAHKPAIVTALEAWARSATMLASALAHCRPLTPADLDPAEQAESEALARELADTGRLGHFAICLAGNWNHIDERDRLAGCYAWQLAATDVPLELAA